MDKSRLVVAGLLPQQAEMYSLLLKEGSLLPPRAASKLKLTRSNAYKLLDKLSELGLADKTKDGKKIVFIPSNPMALTNMVMEARNKVTAREEAVKSMLDELLVMYYEKTEQPTTQIVTGREAVVNAYQQQTNLHKPVYFVRSQTDISSMGFDTMDEIRRGPAKAGQQRYGITPDVTSGPINPEGDVRSNLTRTWVKREDYTAPVEWSVSGSMLLIVLFGQEPHAVIITNPVIADGFKQLWKIMDAGLRATDYYSALPRTSQKPSKA
ncbi:MAG: helix-turn-helix domain-containing protein [Candidatus Saccharibacteria bacterium]